MTHKPGEVEEIGTDYEPMAIWLDDLPDFGEE